jgi:hypothetical protein
MSQKTSRRLAVQWARTNAPVVEPNLLTSFDRAAQRQVNCTFAVSRELTKTKTPHLLSCYGGEVFVFELTQRQAKSFNAVKNTMQCVEGGPSLELPPSTPPLIDVSELRFDDADGLAADEPIRGSLYYSKRGDFGYPGTVCLSMEFALGGRCRTTHYYYPPQGLLPEGDLEFTFTSVAPAQDDRNSAKGFTGPIVAHVRFLGTMNPKAPGNHVPLSNTCAALIEVI